jgi:trans-aconitate methyltransferase
MTTDTINPNQALWEKGDFSRIAVTMRESGEALIAELGITAGSRVLDLGCGAGTTALPQRGWAPTSLASIWKQDRITGIQLTSEARRGRETLFIPPIVSRSSG